MPKELADMTLEELWELFPISLVNHKDTWEADYKLEKEHLLKIIPSQKIVSIYHIGSTAIKGIKAKNIIDILIETSKKEDLHEISSILTTHGYLKMSEDENRISLNKGYTKKGFAEKVYHVHLRLVDDKDEVYFRDYLNTHIEVAKQYEALKLALGKTYKNNRDAYTESKTDFIKKWTTIAKNELV